MKISLLQHNQVAYDAALQMYSQAKRYYETHGNLLVPIKCKTESDYSLGSWLAAQRRIYNGEVPGHLTQQQVEKLEKIGIVWENNLWAMPRKPDWPWELGFIRCARLEPISARTL